jgi:GNAT superfamily N-acetyltransferase
VIFLEEVSESITPPSMDSTFDGYKIVFLGPEDMNSIAAIPGRKPTEVELLSRLNEGKVCLGVKHEQELIAFTWYDLKESNIKGNKHLLKDSEAYLFDAYTLESYRGKGIAPFMRYRSYQELAKMGRRRLLSFCDYFNTAAIRFKEKLKAKPLEFRLASSFKGIHLDLRLKRYGRLPPIFSILYLRCWVKGHKLVEI